MIPKNMFKASTIDSSISGKNSTSLKSTINGNDKFGIIVF